jgi:hypothetical protein
MQQSESIIATDMSYIWRGPIKNGVPHGKGVYTFADGSTYEGETVMDNIQGYGVMTTASYTYNGEWLAGEHHGHGSKQLSDGCQYVGEWFKGRRHGYGRYTWPSGDCYTGMFSKGLYHEYGCFSFHGGEQLAGRWQNDRWQGGHCTDCKTGLSRFLRRSQFHLADQSSPACSQR